MSAHAQGLEPKLSPPPARGTVRGQKNGCAAVNLVNRNILLHGHRTSIRLEPTMWECLEEVATREGLTLHQVCENVKATMDHSSFTAAVRVYVTCYYREAATELGHARAGHGRLR